MTTRILLGTISAGWQRTLLDLVQADSDLEIVGATDDAVDLLMQIQQLKADVVVLSQLPGGGEPGVCSHLLLEYPNVTVLLLPPNGGYETLCRMVLRKEIWKRVSKETLREALKT